MCFTITVLNFLNIDTMFSLKKLYLERKTKNRVHQTNQPVITWLNTVKMRKV